MVNLDTQGDPCAGDAPANLVSLKVGNDNAGSW